MQFSKFGTKFTTQSGILQLMDDLGNAMAGPGNISMLGGGNPSHIPSVQAEFRRRMEAILTTPGAFEAMIGNYDPPQGHKDFVATVANLLQRTYNWPVSEKNIALTNGSQTAFFYLFNLFGGTFDDGSRKKILLPLAPEYIGYGDLGVDEGELFVAGKPQIEHLSEHRFKYRVDFSQVQVTPDTGAICVSRPTNPTGNVLTDAEIAELHQLARQHGLPFIIDGAYGTPFPEIIFTEATPIWDEQTILCLSLSKLGLPGTRTGIIIAPEAVVRAITALNAIANLTPGGFGAILTLDLMRSGDILTISRDLIQPYYRRRVAQALDWLDEALAGTPYAIHVPEGAIFLWAWFKDLPITNGELYERLKARGVIVVSGHYFFPGLQQAWQHQFECIRISYAMAEADVARGMRIIGEEVKRAYAES